MKRRSEVVRTAVAVTLAIGIIGTGAVALPSLSPMRASVEIPPPKGPQLEPDELSAIEGIHENAGNIAGPARETIAEMARALPSTAARIASATTAVTRPT